MKYEKKTLVWMFSFLCLCLAGYDIFNDGDQIGASSLGLLVLAALPLLADYVGSIKAGGMELTFKELSKSEQLFLLLETFARKSRWTFYQARPGESDLGQGLRVFVEDLISSNRQELVKKLQKWLGSEDSPNLRYFAAEVIGYFRIREFKGALQPYYAHVSDDCKWEKWQLNYLWAHSRLNFDNALNRLLMATKIPDNQLWILEAYRQMIHAGEDPDNSLRPLIYTFMDRDDLNNQVIAKVQEVLATGAHTVPLAAV